MPAVAQGLFQDDEDINDTNPRPASSAPDSKETVQSNTHPDHSDPPVVNLDSTPLPALVHLSVAGGGLARHLQAFSLDAESPRSDEPTRANAKPKTPVSEHNIETGEPQSHNGQGTAEKQSSPVLRSQEDAERDSVVHSLIYSLLQHC